MAEMFRYALKLVSRRKLRTVLTSLGIMIAVMLMAFILFGMTDLKDAVVNEFSTRFVPEDLYVSGRDVFSFGGMRSAPSKDDSGSENVILTDMVLDDIGGLDSVVSAEPIFFVSNVEIFLEGDSTPYPFGMVGASNIPGTHHAFNGFWGLRDTLQGNEIFVSDFVVSFFETSKEDIIGETIIVKSSSSNPFLATASKSMLEKEFEFEVVGVTNSGNDAFIINYDDGLRILVELGGFDDGQEYIENVGYDQILVTTKEERTSEVEKYIVEELGLYVISTETLLEFLDTLTSGLTIALAIFGAISALVASIGIINTMIMSIYEQTKEIGIIKAMGASNAQVLVIFLIQSAAIGFIGGILGLSVTYFAMQIANPFIVDLLLEQGFTSLETFFNFQPLNAIYITLGSIFVGILAGLYPAWKASNIDPINALRHD
jgi:ABC-type antimicrobial peptide transport system permease subunit